MTDDGRSIVLHARTPTDTSWRRQAPRKTSPLESQQDLVVCNRRVDTLYKYMLYKSTRPWPAFIKYFMIKNVEAHINWVLDGIG